MGTREEITRAITAGRDAGERGDPATVCPYGRGSILRTAWVKGYAPAARARTARESDRAG